RTRSADTNLNNLSLVPTKILSRPRRPLRGGGPGAHLLSSSLAKGIVAEFNPLISHVWARRRKNLHRNQAIEAVPCHYSLRIVRIVIGRREIPVVVIDGRGGFQAAGKSD